MIKLPYIKFAAYICSMIIHIDCNTFFASCELATRPELVNEPVIVANINEAGGGIILALNKPAKDIGLKRGIPIFQLKNIVDEKSVTVFPVDHKKYHRISQTIMEAVIKQDIIQNFVQYSVDEFFGSMPIEDPEEVKFYVKKVVDEITRVSNIPVSCGCSNTYTLAKTATHFAKIYPGYKGICVLTPEKREKALSLLPIEDVWGIGRKLREKLKKAGIKTALDFVKKEHLFVQNIANTQGVKTWLELKGTPSIKLEQNELQQSIGQSQTFTYMTSDYETMRSYISDFTTICCSKLRQQNGVCKAVNVFIATNRHRDDLEQYNNNISIRTNEYTANTQEILKAALSGLEKIFKPNYMYKQAGVTLTDICNKNQIIHSLFETGTEQKRAKLMQAIDNINAKFGEEKIHLAIQEKRKQKK